MLIGGVVLFFLVEGIVILVMLGDDIYILCMGSGGDVMVFGFEEGCIIVVFDSGNWFVIVVIDGMLNGDVLCVLLVVVGVVSFGLLLIYGV